MESELEQDLAALGYEPCEDETDSGWVRCVRCRSKVYAGKNPTDLARHEERCEWR